MKFNDELEECPLCKSSWRGALIPPKDRHLFAGTKPHFSRLIGVELPYSHPKHYDGVSFWQCPDCDGLWDRWTGERVWVGDDDHAKEERGRKKHERKG